jgi:hypothetical protein
MERNICLGEEYNTHILAVCVVCQGGLPTICIETYVPEKNTTHRAGNVWEDSPQAASEHMSRRRIQHAQSQKCLGGGPPTEMSRSKANKTKSGNPGNTLSIPYGIRCLPHSCVLDLSYVPRICTMFQCTCLGKHWVIELAFVFIFGHYLCFYLHISWKLELKSLCINKLIFTYFSLFIYKY